MMAVSGERIFEALDRQCRALPMSMAIDSLYGLLERDGVPIEENDRELVDRMDHVSRWADLRGVRIRT